MRCMAIGCPCERGKSEFAAKLQMKLIKHVMFWVFQVHDICCCKKPHCAHRIRCCIAIALTPSHTTISRSFGTESRWNRMLVNIEWGERNQYLLFNFAIWIETNMLSYPQTQDAPLHWIFITMFFRCVAKSEKQKKLRSFSIEKESVHKTKFYKAS